MTLRSLAGLAGGGGGPAAPAERAGAAAERAVRGAEHLGRQQLRTGPGEVQYLYGLSSAHSSGKLELCSVQKLVL